MDLIAVKVDKEDLIAERADETSEEWHRIPSLSSDRDERKGETQPAKEAPAPSRGNDGPFPAAKKQDRNHRKSANHCQCHKKRKGVYEIKRLHLINSC